MAEAAMYQADIEFGMKQHPWRKVLDQCFSARAQQRISRPHTRALS